MTDGQVMQLHELSKCHMAGNDGFMLHCLKSCFYNGLRLNKTDEAWLRRLWHLYRHQINAMRKNRKAAL